MAHLIRRVRQREISTAQLGPLAGWLATDPEVPEGRWFRKYYGPTMNAFEAAEKQGRAAELQKQLEDLFNSENKSQEDTSIPATFLRVTVERK